MTAIIDRDVITAAQGAAGGVAGADRRATPSPHRRGAARARGVSPRLSRARAAEGAAGSITVSNAVTEGAVRTATGPVRVTGARGASTRSVERIRVRPAARRMPRGASRVDGCARRSPRVTFAACLVAAAGAFLGVVLLFGGAPQEAQASDGAAAQRAGLTTMVTVREGQSLEQIAHEVAPERATATVAAEIAEINGLQDGRIRPGQTLVTPRS
ncbi:LysM peptidoglycan-binding domain-containing protein [Tsukamurella sp. 1534]|uniref:LysM peptidoglycan-binding domain-containing protein n=1 Tax=Tsukamurella sp. 1534 TaxID=1151061 RepID=UPI0002FDEB8E|nr:LysM peptidoglycan-binding domain-containing protein [Tsukamurella sp. 1534]